jgi:hypothetical protein
MTYRQKIQGIIIHLQNIYDELEGLRDQSDSQGQKYINQARGVLPDVWSPLQNLDNSLSDEMAGVKLE